MKLIRYIIPIFILYLTGITTGSFSQELTILHTNDMHSKLTGNGPENEYSPLSINDDKTLGGFARLATVFKNIKEEKKDAAIIVDGGDYLMGSLFHVSEEYTGFQLHLMKEIGYDVITLGNHEFDFGPSTLESILMKAKEKGGYPQIVASNIVTEHFIESSEILSKIPEYVIIEKNGIKIGIFGLIGEDAVDVAPAAAPVSFSNPVKAAKKVVKKLKEEEQVDVIMCLSHGGLYYSKEEQTYKGEDVDLAQKVNGIDIIISGHSHTKVSKPVKVNNCYIVQAGSYAKFVGRMDINYENGHVKLLDYKLIPIDDKIIGDEEVHKKIEDHIAYIDEHYLKQMGITFKDKIAETEFDLYVDHKVQKNSNLGPFVVEADKYYLEQKGTTVDFSILAAGTIRDKLIKGEKGIITVPDAFRVMSLGEGKDDMPGYPLAKVYISAKELKKFCEIIVLSRKMGGDYYLFTSGIKIYINPKKMTLRKVQKVELYGKEIDLSKKNNKLYSLSANGYMLSFIDRVKKMSYGLVKIVPKDQNGNIVTDMTKQYIDINPDKEGIQEAKEWMALIEYMKSFEKGEKGLPAIPDKYKKGDESLVEIE